MVAIRGHGPFGSTYHDTTINVILFSSRSFIHIKLFTFATMFISSFLLTRTRLLNLDLFGGNPTGQHPELAQQIY